MNAFANTLFSLLLSWVKGLAQSVWSMVSGGGAGSFFVWLGDHWLALVLVLCVAGVVIDLLVWLLRWRPDLVWRTRWRRLFSRREEGTMDRGDERRFYGGYQEGVNWQQDDGYQAPAPWQDEQAWQPQPVQEEPVWWDEAPQGVQEEPVYEVQEEPLPQVRRRRSDKYQKTERRQKLSRIKDKLLDAQEDDSAMLDGLTPSVDSRQAFYEPVFPQQEQKKS